MSAESYFIKTGYLARSTRISDPDFAAAGMILQPDLYPFAGFVARRFGCRYIFDVGCHHVRQLIQLHPEFRIVGVGGSDNVQRCRQQYPFAEWVEWDLEAIDAHPFEADVLRQSLVVCADVIQRSGRPNVLLDYLRRLLDYAPAAILTTPERDLAHGPDEAGPPVHPLYVREWNLAELEMYLKSRGLTVLFSGLARNNDRDREKNVSMVILENNQTPPIRAAAASFKVLAVIAVYNEEDVLVPVIEHLYQREGVEVYVIDNWSTDRSFELAGQMLQRGVIGLERWPAAGPSAKFDFMGLLRRKAELCRELPADWFIHFDADEIRESPWVGVPLRDALYWTEQQGFNAIDFTTIDFMPVEDDYRPGSSLAEHFKFFEFGKHGAYSRQIKAWKKTDAVVDLSRSGGHSAEFAGRRVYPYKYLMRHYPFRTQAHAQRKVFDERRPRYDPDLKRLGWHRQYDDRARDSSFLHSPDELLEFGAGFHGRYLVERLSGLGIDPASPRLGAAAPGQAESNQHSFDPLEHPICFVRPLRLKPQAAWTEHIPFGMAIVDMARPGTMVELGVNRGVSYGAFCQAVSLLKLPTRCYGVDTWKGDRHTGSYGPEVLADLRAHHDALYGAFSQLMQGTFDQAAPSFSDGSIDLLHIDGLHTYAAVKHDFEAWLPKLSRRGVVLFHDTHVHKEDFGVWKLWEELKPQYPHFEFFHGYGLGILGVGDQLPAALDRLMRANEADAKRIRDFFALLGSQLASITQEDVSIQRLESRLAQGEQAALELQKNLDQRKTELAEIHGSRAWRFIELLRRIRVLFIPPGSRVERIFYRLLK